MLTPVKVAFACYLACALPNRAAVVLWDEAISGDLSDDYTTPTLLTTVLGDNRVVGSLRGTDLDLDLFTLTVSAGHELRAIRLVDYTTANPTNVGFMGMQPGSNLSNPPSNSFPDPIGYVLYGTWAIGQDILPTVVGGQPFNGINPLPADQYAVWLNETGASSRYQWSFEVAAIPEPGVLVMLNGCLLGTLLRRKRPEL